MVYGENHLRFNLIFDIMNKVIFVFRDITIEDKQLFDRFEIDQYFASELNFANVFAWKAYDQLQIYHDEKMFIIKGRDFFFPPCFFHQSDCHAALQWMREYCQKEQITLRIVGITNEIKQRLPHEELDVFSHPELSEYLYLAQDLITYKGKSFHSKRNFVNQFIKKYTYTFKDYEPSMRNDILSLIDLWAETKHIAYEKQPILTILDHLTEIDAFCGCLLINDKVEAFAIGTTCNQSGIVLFEKANLDFDGIYPMLINQFAKRYFSNVKYINRQEDLGDDGLRKSKLSYNPIGLIDKYQAVEKPAIQLRHIHELSFFDRSSYIDYFINKKPKHLIHIEKNHIIQSVLYYRHTTLTIEDKQYPSAFLFALATHPQFRNQGLMRQLLIQSLQSLEKEGFIFAFLHPDIEHYYEKFGFVPIGIDIKPSMQHGEETTDLSTVANLYNEFVQSYAVHTVRSNEDWQNMFDEISNNGGYIHLIKVQNRATGYQVFDGDDIIEACPITQPSIIEHTYNRIRILNLRALHELITKKNLIRFCVEDPIIQNNEISLGDAFDNKSISIDSLTQMIFASYQALLFDKY